MDQRTLDALCEYYIDAAYRIGFSQKGHEKDEEPDNLRDDGWQAGYSLAWYFSTYFKHDLLDPAPKPDGTTTNLLGAYFGHGKLATPDPKDYEEQWAHERNLLAHGFPADRNPLNEEQSEAVRKALHNPISLIKGPAGTGKTEVIMHIIALALSEGQTVAMVSSNRSAVDNVVEKARESYQFGQGESAEVQKADLAYQAALKLAPLGATDAREKATPLNGDAEAFSFGNDVRGGWEQGVSFAEFTQERGYPFITSTVHSLKKCFSDGATEKYDLLIMDEASQTSQLVGIVALSCAKRAVIVGDEMQLPPVVPETTIPSLEGLWDYRLSEAAQDCDDLQSIYSIATKNGSFLKSCYEVFDPEDTTAGRMVQTATKTVLTKHYRCPKPIIEFCNGAIYDEKLEPCSSFSKDFDGDRRFPMSLVWYEGDYRESSWLKIPRAKSEGGKRDQRWGKKLKENKLAFHSSSINEKQLAIMRYEEIPRLKKLLEQDSNLSVCFLSPFNAQVRLLENLLKETLPAEILSTAELTELSEETDGQEKERSHHGRDKVSALTIHKSQGQGFDIVYLLPVEDGNWEWPWSQGRELINVAVSRAKCELRVVMSTKLMSEKLQEELCGRRAEVVAPAREEDDTEDEQLFMRKLASYMTEICPIDVRRPFGVSQTMLRSIFDDAPYVDIDRSVEQENRDSTPQAILRNALFPIAQERGLYLYEEVPLSKVQLHGKSLVDCIHSRQGAGAPVPAHFDFVVCRKDGRVVLLAEADGGFHRFLSRNSPLRTADKATQKINKLSHVSMDDKQRGHTEKICDYHHALSDLHKNLVVTDLCEGRVLHLGRDSSLRDRREYFAWAYTQDKNYDAEKDVGPDEVTAPEELVGVMGTSLLRVPSDGSTFLETRRLRELTIRGLAPKESLPSDLPPTIEDYLDVCEENLAKHPEQALSLDPARAEDYLVSEKQLAHIEASKRALDDDHALSLTRTLKKLGEEDSTAKALLEGKRATDVQPLLQKAGLLERHIDKKGKSTWAPTPLGRQIGMGLRTNPESPGESWPIYSVAAREYLNEHLEELMRG